jgi:hypothetical protein
MTDTALREPVSLVLEQDVPVRLIWRGMPYYVDEPPIALGQTVPTLEESEPDPALVTGWRLRCSTASGESHTFDVKSSGHARWNLASVRA